MGENAESSLVRVERTLPGSAERVFDMWLDAQTAGEWLFSEDYCKAIHVKIEPKVSGKFCFVERRKAEDVEYRGEYLEIERPNRLVFMLHVPKISAEQSKVTVEIEPISDQECQLRLVQEGVLYSTIEAAEAQWTDILKALSLMLV